MTALPPDPGLTLVLGSGSPRRLELLAQLGLSPAAVRPPDIDESVRDGELPRPYVERIARAKALAIPLAEGEVALAADTTVAVGRRILGKPVDAAEARAFLTLLSGRRHTVLTSVAVRRGDDLRQKTVPSTLRMKRLTGREIDGYLATEDWAGKAGAYGIQGFAATFVPWLQGSYSGVVGLPLAETAGLLSAMGFVLPWAAR